MSNLSTGCGLTAGSGILLAAINAKWIHPSLALRLLKANLGPLEQNCTIIEFALRQPLREKIEPIIESLPRILGLSVSIWNHTATLELLRELYRLWVSDNYQIIDRQLSDNCPSDKRPIIVLGGPEVSYLPHDAEIFRYADYCIIGEAEVAFRELCKNILIQKSSNIDGSEISPLKEKIENSTTIFINRNSQQVNVAAIKSAYHLYNDEDVHKKLIYVEASRGCPFGCEFCQSGNSKVREPLVREFPLEPFLVEMDTLIQRGTHTFKFLDRTFNLNIERARQIIEFFIKKIEEQSVIKNDPKPFVVHFEMVPSRFPPELIETLALFPPDTLRLEIGIQTLNPEVSARISRPSDPERELATLALLRQKTSAIIHADLIAGLPGEDMASFGKGFDLLWAALSPPDTVISDSIPNSITQRRRGAEEDAEPAKYAQNFAPSRLREKYIEKKQTYVVPCSVEIQLGILKLLPGTAIARHSSAFGMRYNPSPPYEIIETAAFPARDLDRIKNFARFWELIINRALPVPFIIDGSPVFDRFMALSDSLLARFGRNWGIAKNELLEALLDNISR